MSLLGWVWTGEPPSPWHDDYQRDPPLVQMDQGTMPEIRLLSWLLSSPQIPEPKTTVAERGISNPTRGTYTYICERQREATRAKKKRVEKIGERVSETQGPMTKF